MTHDARPSKNAFFEYENIRRMESLCGLRNAQYYRLRQQARLSCNESDGTWPCTADCSTYDINKYLQTSRLVHAVEPQVNTNMHSIGLGGTTPVVRGSQ